MVDGQVTALSGPQSFTVKLLDQSSLPTNMAANATFLEKVSTLRKAAGAASDILSNLESRIGKIESAVTDMPAAPGDILGQAAVIRKKLIDLNLRLNGDGTAASRQFEVAPAINDRIFGIQGALWPTTSQVPKTYSDSYQVAHSQFGSLMSDLKAADASIRQLESLLEKNGAPYTPGRWPDKW